LADREPDPRPALYCGAPRNGGSAYQPPTLAEQRLADMKVALLGLARDHTKK
jgi:hypothetical protein